MACRLSDSSKRDGRWQVVCLTAFLALSAVGASPCYTNVSRTQYPSCSQLSTNVALHWTVSDGAITWALHVDGVWDWVGLGISEGGMLGADIAVASHDVNSSQWTASDYWSTGFRFPQLDSQQDVALISVRRDSKAVGAAGVNGSTLVEMRRPLVTCDAANQDRPILDDTRQTVIFAYGSGSFGYHGTQNRGQSEVVFVPNVTAGGAGGAATIPSLLRLDVRMTTGFVVPTAATTYQCVNLALPNDTKYHIYRYEPLLDNTPLVHHFVAYSCPGSKPPATPPGVSYDCLQSMECEEFYMLWAPGGGAVDAPPLAALPFGAGTNIRYLVLQIHYTNLQGVQGQTDTSGFRILYSPVLKQYDMGVLTLGSYNIAIPPGVATWSTNPNVCPGACMAALAGGASTGLTLVESAYHMHVLGRSMVTRHVRGGVELPPLGSREYYGFEYQTAVDLPPGARQLMPGDFLITTCTYTGEGRASVTSYGPASYDEMCFNFLTYYPYNSAITECIERPEISSATCTTRSNVSAINDSQTATQAGLLIASPANFTYTPYAPVCTRTAKSASGGFVAETAVSTAVNDTTAGGGGNNTTGAGSTGGSNNIAAGGGSSGDGNNAAAGGGSGDGDSGLSAGALAGIIVGSVMAGLLLAAGVGVAVYRAVRRVTPADSDNAGA